MHFCRRGIQRRDGRSTATRLDPGVSSAKRQQVAEQEGSAEGSVCGGGDHAKDLQEVLNDTNKY